MGTMPAGELAYALDRVGAAFAHHIGGAELARERDAGGMAAEEDNAFRAQALCSDDATEAHRAVTDDGDVFTGTDLGNHGCVVARPHDIRQREERGHQGVVLAHREGEQRSIRIGNPNCLGLRTIGSTVAEETNVDASGRQAFVTEDAGTVGKSEGHYHHISALHRAHFGADGFDHADRFVSHPLALIGWLHRPIRPQVAAADTGARYADQGVGGLDNGGVGNAFDPDVTRGMHDGCAHSDLPRHCLVAE